MALEVPIDCLTNGGDVIGGWTTALLPRTSELDEEPTFDRPALHSSDFVQVSRLGMPLVNELVIGLKDKNLYNASHPSKDNQFLDYFSNPSLPALIPLLFPGVQAPTNFPRFDWFWFFLVGIPEINFVEGGTRAEMLRLNTATPSVPAAGQHSLGVGGGDKAGFPNGRRPGDDVLDYFLRVAMGVFCVNNPSENPLFVACQPADAPSGNLDFTDQTPNNASFFENQFPYLRSPLPGSVIEDESGCDHKIYFPRFVVGDLAGTGFTSLVTLKNFTKKTCTGTLFFYKDNFNPIGLVRCNGTLAPLGKHNITLGPSRGTSLSCDRPAGGAQGFAVFEPGPGCWTSDFAASGKIQVSLGGDIVDLVGVTTSSNPSTSFEFFVERKTLNNRTRETAFAMAPCSPEPYDYTLEFWSLSGGETVTKQGTATGPIAQFVREALSELGSEHEGTLRVETSEKIQPEVLTVLTGDGVPGGAQLSPVLFDRDAKRH